MAMNQLAGDEPDEAPDSPPEGDPEEPHRQRPEIPGPDRDSPKPNVTPEIPNLPMTPESERPSMPEVGPAPDVVEMPTLPDGPEVGVPERELPGGVLH